jgi:hypothetical protein
MHLNLGHSRFSKFTVFALSQLFYHSMSLIEVNLAYVKFADPLLDIN